MLTSGENSDVIREKFNLKERIVFGFVGFFLHVSSWHFLEWFLPAFIKAVHETRDVVLFLVGEGPGRTYLEEVGRSMDFEDRLIFSGQVPNSQIGDYLNAMDVGVVPHTNEYRSPIKMFEYMAFGKPILAPDEEPVESIIGRIQGKYLFKAKSGESMKEAITRMLEDRGNWEKIGEELRELVATRFTYEKHSETILHLLE
jgi:glycosyltransferase involved in cell wall biosynthesis